ncbi:MAG: type II toxin-antitoxin system HicA family toxin [Oscillibacter sp.]|nr:type II toxin-antitoxin system HicA family toxin [Oscillibacter sp.]
MNARRKAIQALKEAGYHYERDGGNHEIYSNDELGAMIPVRHHFTDEDLKVILKEIKQYEKGK